MRVDAGKLTDLGARVIVGALFTLLSVNIASDFSRTGRVTGLLLLGSESLIVVLTIARRRSNDVDRSIWAALATGMSIGGPPLLRTGSEASLLPDAVTAAVSVVGLAVVVFAKLSLGRSFGIAPANRGIVAAGPYTVVRHPIYAGYLVTHAAFLVAHPRVGNVFIVLVADSALIIRALLEERLLGHDAGYRAYCRRVSWHLVPGIY